MKKIAAAVAVGVLASVFAAASFAAPPDVTVVSVSGRLLVGTELSAGVGVRPDSDLSKTWEVTKVEWQRCTAAGTTCVDIPGATTETWDSYTLTAADLGHAIRVIVTVKDVDGAVTRASVARGPVLSPDSAPFNIGAPPLVGKPVVGGYLNTAQGKWVNGGLGYFYQWQRCKGANCTAIPGAKEREYRVQPVDVGYTLRASVTTGSRNGKLTTAYSKRSAVITKR